MRQALEDLIEAVETAINAGDWKVDGACDPTLALIRAKEALAQPEQEPVAMKFKIYKPTAPDPMRQDINDALLPWVYDQSRDSGFVASMWVTPVSTLPPQRTWVGLTDEEIADCAEKMEASDPTDSFWREFFRGIEAKLKEKNF